jgi:hypothetical protein
MTQQYQYQHRMTHAAGYRILRLLDVKNGSFEYLLENTWGIYPAQLNSILNDLEKAGLIKKNKDKTWGLVRKNKSTRRKLKESYGFVSEKDWLNVDKGMEELRRELPEPHPHDFDWRFSSESLKSFSRYLIEHHSYKDRVCVMAAPLIYIYLHILDYFEHIVLIERNLHTIEKIKDHFPEITNVISHDLQYPIRPLFSGSPEGEYSCIIADPPWYQDYYELFLSRAKDIVKPGGLVHLALFPPFAKSSALRERTAIFSFAQNNGMDLIELKSGLLGYDTPPFEIKALQSEITEGEISTSLWRKGDVATFYVSNKTGQDIIIPVETGDWVEFIIGKSKFKLRHKESEDQDIYQTPNITYVIPGSPYLPSVSRNYLYREKIDLWTSHNQAYIVEGSHIVEIMLKGLEESQSIENTIDLISEKFNVPIQQITSECNKIHDILTDILKREEKNE